jgi:hypothetical protein
VDFSDLNPLSEEDAGTVSDIIIKEQQQAIGERNKQHETYRAYLNLGGKEHTEEDINNFITLDHWLADRLQRLNEIGEKQTIRQFLKDFLRVSDAEIDQLSDIDRINQLDIQPGDKLDKTTARRIIFNCRELLMNRTAPNIEEGVLVDTDFVENDNDIFTQFEKLTKLTLIPPFFFQQLTNDYADNPEAKKAIDYLHKLWGDDFPIDADAQNRIKESLKQILSYKEIEWDYFTNQRELYDSISSSIHQDVKLMITVDRVLADSLSKTNELNSRVILLSEYGFSNDVLDAAKTETNLAEPNMKPYEAATIVIFCRRRQHEIDTAR